MSAQDRKRQRREQIIKLRRKGLTNGQIAAELGVSTRVVSTLIYRAKQEGMDVPPPPYWSRGRSG